MKRFRWLLCLALVLPPGVTFGTTYFAFTAGAAGCCANAGIAKTMLKTMVKTTALFRILDMFSPFLI